MLTVARPIARCRKRFRNRPQPRAFAPQIESLQGKQPLEEPCTRLGPKFLRPPHCKIGSQGVHLPSKTSRLRYLETERDRTVEQSPAYDIQTDNRVGQIDPDKLATSTDQSA